MYRWIILSFILLVSSPAWATLVEENIEYKEGETVLEGYIVYDDSQVTKKTPGILVVHDWMGLSNYTKVRARQLADLGYVAMAVDIYGKGVRPKDQKEAAAQAGIYKNNRDLMRARIQAALDRIRQHPLVDSEQIASMGYCFGGTVSLELARSGADVDGVVSFHGGLDTPQPASAETLKAKILVLHGADDPFVPVKDVLAFEDEMRQAKADWQLVSYGNAVHSFTKPEAGNDPSTGNAYNKKAEERSWMEMQSFYLEIFSQNSELLQN